MAVTLLREGVSRLKKGGRKVLVCRLSWWIKHLGLASLPLVQEMALGLQSMLLLLVVVEQG